jgi:hypothetical protein
MMIVSLPWPKLLPPLTSYGTPSGVVITAFIGDLRTFT